MTAPVKKPMACWCVLFSGDEVPVALHPSRALARKFAMAWSDLGAFRIVRYIPDPVQPAPPKTKKRRGK